MSPIIRRKGEKFTLPSKYLLFILTCFCTGLMVISFSTDFLSTPLNIVAGAVVVPFQKGISSVGGFLKNRSEELVQIRSLLTENQELRNQINELTIENTQLQQQRYELITLRELYDLDNQYEEYEKVGARIISADSGNWYHSFIIDKGSDDGIEVDMNVIADGGLVGRVESVGPGWARVKSIIADDSNVSGLVLATEDRLMISGDLEQMKSGSILFSQLVDSEQRVVEGDKIVTSHISSKFLPNILIGYISSITVDANNLTKSGTITPAVDFEHLESVLVILQLKQEVVED